MFQVRLQGPTLLTLCTFTAQTFIYLPSWVCMSRCCLIHHMSLSVYMQNRGFPTSYANVRPFMFVSTSPLKVIKPLRTELVL